MSRSRAVVAAVVVGLALALAACNGDSSDAGPDPSTSPSPTSATSPTPVDDTASETPSGEASPAVTPASGPLLKMPNATMNAPQGWRSDEDIVDFQTDATSRDYISTISLGALAYDGPTLPLELQAKSLVDKGSGQKRMPDREIDGVTFLHITDRPDKYNTREEFTVRDDGYQTRIIFSLSRELTTAEREQLIDEVLASFQWR